MFGTLGFTEIAFILVLALLIFGPKRLPEIGRTIGKGLSEFRRASNDLKRTLEQEVALDDVEARRAPLKPAATSRPASVEVAHPQASSATGPEVPPAGVAPATRSSAGAAEPAAADELTGEQPAGERPAAEEEPRD